GSLPCSLDSSACPHSSALPAHLLLSTAPVTTAIYTLSLHDALPISFSRGSPRQGAICPRSSCIHCVAMCSVTPPSASGIASPASDRKSTRLNSIHGSISYAVFCLKKKKENNKGTMLQ